MESKRRKTQDVYGIFEGCIGVNDDSLADTLSYFALQGFRPAKAR